MASFWGLASGLPTEEALALGLEYSESKLGLLRRERMAFVMFDSDKSGDAGFKKAVSWPSSSAVESLRAFVGEEDGSGTPAGVRVSHFIASENFVGEDGGEESTTTEKSWSDGGLDMLLTTVPRLDIKV